METKDVNHNIGPEELKDLVATIVEGVAEAVFDRKLGEDEMERIRQRTKAEVTRHLRGVRATVESLLGNGYAVGAGPEKQTPPELARRWGIKPEKVLTWIRSGELRAIDVATQQRGRPRYLIDPSDVETFEQRRAVLERPALSRRRRRRSKDAPRYF